MPYLRVRDGKSEPFELELANDTFTIGRGPSNNLHFQSPWLSRVHARVVARGDGHMVVDQGSRNGTYLNGQFLREPRQLKHGDRIAIGDIQIRYMTSGGALEVSEGSTPLAKGTVILSSDELSYNRYSEPQPITSAGLPDDGASLMPALHAAASALITYVPIDRLVELVLDLVMDAVPADRAALLLRPEEPGGELKIEAVRGYGATENVQISRTIVDTVLGNRKAVLTVDAQADDRFEQAQSIMLQGIRSIICVPLWNNREVIGLVYLDHRFKGRVFSKNDLRLVGLIANMAAVKIENAWLLAAQLEQERLKQQLTVGAQIQRKLLPDGNPEVEGYEICGVNRSCFEIGGDYYDFIAKPDGRLAVVIADISGKGIGAALLMAVLQASVRALVHTTDSPAEMASRLNQVLIENSPYNKFATLFYAELEPSSGRLAYVNGGHNAALRLIPGGAMEELRSTGPIVGMIEGASFENGEIEMAPGEVVVLYTDGITELAADDGDEFGLERLAAVIAEQPERTGGELIEAVREANEAFAATEALADDTTLVVIRRLHPA